MINRLWAHIYDLKTIQARPSSPTIKQDQDLLYDLLYTEDV
jgi:hypothetical protein